MFEKLPPAVDDPILGLFQSFQKDPRTEKVNLGIGIYCDDQGKVPLLNAVKIARTEVLNSNAPSVYLPTEGIEAYRAGVRGIVFGKMDAQSVSDTVVVQSVAGTGALRVGADFLKEALDQANIWIPDPSWPNHEPLFVAAGFQVNSYPYYEPSSGRFDLEGALRTFGQLKEASVLLLHPCCHNPTGVDPTREEWGALLDVIESRGLLPFFDMAYQGFATGVEEDAWVIRECVRRGIKCLVASSFSKIFSLYGERVGALSVFAPGADATKVMGQLKVAIRRTYSNPPALGAALVQTILGNAALNLEWRNELASMRARMQQVRAKLHARLTDALPSKDFDYLIKQNGMFSYTGLSADQVADLRHRFGIYALTSGRICVAGANSSNIDYVCESLSKVYQS